MGLAGEASLLRQVSVSSHDNGVPKWLGLSSTPAGCLLPCIDQVPANRLRYTDTRVVPQPGNGGSLRGLESGVLKLSYDLDELHSRSTARHHAQRSSRPLASAYAGLAPLSRLRRHQLQTGSRL